MSQPSMFWWQKYGTLAQMAQAAVALLGFVAILFQINEIRSNNRAASARQAFLGYTDLAFKNPKFSQPDYENIKAGSREEQVQYSFVTYLLYACEEAISAFAGRREWLASCDYDLRPHLPFFCAKNANEPAMKLYTAQVAKYEPTADTTDGIVGYGWTTGALLVKTLESAKKLDRGSVMEAARTLKDVSGVGLQIPAAKWNTSADDWFIGETFQFIQWDATAGHSNAVAGGLTNDDGKTAELTPEELINQ